MSNPEGRHWYEMTDREVIELYDLVWIDRSEWQEERYQFLRKKEQIQLGWELHFLEQENEDRSHYGDPS